MRAKWFGRTIGAIPLCLVLFSPANAIADEADARIRERMAAYFETVQVAAQDDLPMPESPAEAAGGDPPIPSASPSTPDSAVDEAEPALETLEPFPLELPSEPPAESLDAPTPEPYYEDRGAGEADAPFVDGEHVPGIEYFNQPTLVHHDGCYDGCSDGACADGSVHYQSAHGGWYPSYNPEDYLQLQSMMRPMGQMLGDIWIDAWMAQGFTWNGDSPKNRFNTPVTFNDRANEFQLNQMYLSMSKAADSRRRRFGVGGQIDLLYGTDYYFTTATGLETNSDGTQKWNSDDGPRGAALYGLAMPQLFAEFYAPFGQGTSVKFGHFYTIMGYESVQAPNNFFYSHSYSMQYGEPFTHTGFLGTQRVGRNLQVHGGLTRGWDNWEDTNNDLGFLGGVEWTSRDGRSSLSYGMHVGTEQSEPPRAGGERTTYSLIFSQQMADALTYVIQHDRGFEDDVRVTPNTVVDGNWYSIVQYLLLDLNDTIAAGMRCEWFRDEDGTRVEGNRLIGDYFSCTWGLNIVPINGVVIRPELRWDWTNTHNASPFDDRSDTNQLLLSSDVILRY